MVLDTHQWIWLVTADARLSHEVLEQIERDPTALRISAASVYETLALMQKGRIGTKGAPLSTVEEWLLLYPIPVVPITLEITMLAGTLAFQHKDPMDRFIASTSHAMGVPLATRDEQLTALPWLKTVA
ncbi:PIN domain-containing protein [bacterium]|nr:MAG: PIN domain-containing protein [bacterium]